MSRHAVIVIGRFQPPTAGHHKMVQHAMDLATQMGADHIIYGSRSEGDADNPLPTDVKKQHMMRIFGTQNVVVDKGLTSAIDQIKHAHDLGYKKLTLVAGGGRVKSYENFKRYFGKKNISEKTGAVLDLRGIRPEDYNVVGIDRDPDSDSGKLDISHTDFDRKTGKMKLAKVSGSLVRAAAGSGDFKLFHSMMPEHVSEEDSRKLMSDLATHMKRLRTEGLHPVAGGVLNEIVSAQTRLKLARVARRTAKRRGMLRRLRARKRKTTPQLQRRAKQHVKDVLRKRVYKGNWKKLSYSQRANIDSRINKKKRDITTMVKRIMPEVVRDESKRLQRLQGLNNSFDPVIDNFFANYLSEARTPKRPEQDSEGKKRRKNQNKENKRAQRERDETKIKAGDLKGAVMVVKNDVGDIEIIDKESYDPVEHDIVVDSKKATKGNISKYIENPEFVNTVTSEKLFGYIQGAGDSKTGKGKKEKKEEKPKAKSEKKEKEKGPSKEQKSAQRQMMPEQPGEWDLEQGTIEPKRKQSKNCSLPTSHDAKIVEPAMAVFANAANGIDFKKQVEMGLVDEDVMKAILKSPHKSLHESAQRMGNALVNHYGQRVYFKVVGSKLEDVKLSKKAEEGGLTNKTSKADVHIFSMDTNELIDTASVKCGASQASSGNWQDSTVGLQWTLDNANNFGITLPKDVVKEVEDLISFISDPNEYAGNEVTARGPTNLYKARGAFAGQDPTFTKKEKANKTLTEKMNKLFKKSPEVLALYALTQMTGFHKFEENSTAIARSMIAVSHDGTQVKIGQIDLELAKKLKIDVASRIKSSSAASKAQELEWDNLQEQAKKSGKTLTDVDDFRPYGYRNTIRTVINEVDLRTLKENKSPLTSMSGVSIFKMLTENNKKDSQFYNVGTSPEEVEQNLKDLKEISKEDPMQVFQIVNSAFDYDDISPKVDFLDLLPTEGYTVNRVYVNGKEFRIPVEMPYDYPVPGMQVPQVSLEEQNLFERNYRKEYDNYHSKPEQRKNRSKRVLARRLMMKLGRVKKGDGKDVDHKDGNPRNNGKHNLRVRSKSENRADND